MATTKPTGSGAGSPLDRSDFTDVPDPKAQAIVLIFADTGAGKTTFGLRYCPDPIAFFDINRRGFHAAQASKVEGRVIKYLPIDYPSNYSKLTEQQAQAAGQKSLDLMEKNFDIALEANRKGDIRTILIDTMTEYAEIVNIALVGRPERRDDDYGKSAAAQKAVLSKMIKRARETDVHLVMLGQPKEIYEVPAGGKRKEGTGKYTFRGPDVMATDADWAGHLRLQKPRTALLRGSDKAKLHEIEITKAGIYLPALGEVLKEEDWVDMGGPFVYGCVVNFPDSSPGDWV
jgi:hypothetical protein